MKYPMTLKILMTAILITLLRSLIEVFRLWNAYPVATEPVRLTCQIVPVYLLITSIAGSIVAGAFILVTNRKYRSAIHILICLILPMICLDILGMTINTPTDYLSDAGINPQYQRPENAPDVLLITIDTLRADHLGSYGNPMVYTPTLDKVARRGLLIEDVITSIPVTTSGHATILTGTDPPEHGSRFNAVPVLPGVDTLAEAFHRNGYETAAFVSAFPVTAAVSDLHRGFNQFDQLLTPSQGHPLIYRALAVRWLSHLRWFRAAERKGKTTTSAMLKWLDSTHNTWFSWVHYYDPHFPYKPDQKYQQLYLDDNARYSQSVFDIASVNRGEMSLEPEQIAQYKALYMAEVSGVDAEVEKIIRQLAEQNRLNNTLIVITSDHGESLDEHDNFFTHGDDLFDPALRVPWLAAYHSRIMSSGRVAGGQAPLNITSGIIATVTGLDFLSVNPLSRSILNIWKGQNTRLPDGNSYCETGAGVYTAAHVPSTDSLSRKDRAVRTHSHKVISNRDGRLSGFDLENDPGEEVEQIEMSSHSYQSLTADLFEYIQRVEPPEGVNLIPMDESVLEKLQILGYIN